MHSQGITLFSLYLIIILSVHNNDVHNKVVHYRIIVYRNKYLRKKTLCTKELCTIKLCTISYVLNFLCIYMCTTATINLCTKTIVHNKPVHNKAVHNNFTPKLGIPCPHIRYIWAARVRVALSGCGVRRKSIGKLSARLRVSLVRFLSHDATARRARNENMVMKHEKQ